jgi:hypothetical protein
MTFCHLSSGIDSGSAAHDARVVDQDVDSSERAIVLSTTAWTWSALDTSQTIPSA